MVLGMTLMFALAAPAQAVTPSITSVRIVPRTLPSSGGSFLITAHVRGATSCTVTAYGLGAPRSPSCSSGRISYRRHAPANTHSAPERWTVQIEAHRGHRSAFAQAVAEVLPRVDTQSPAESAQPPVVDLDACVPSASCDYGAAYEAFENWGNIAPENFGDCTFAAAANWEQILFHWQVFPTLLGYDFAQAGGTTTSGLSQTALWRYWERSDIGGSYLTGLHSYTLTPEAVRNGVRDYAAMIVQFSFGEGWAFAQYKVAAGFHDAVVMGFTPAGPLIASWGQVLQMTWEQWSDEAIGMWGISATDPNT
jgi:hypothetical protein